MNPDHRLRKPVFYPSYTTRATISFNSYQLLVSYYLLSGPMVHTYLTIIVPAIVAFLVALAATRFLMGYMYESGVTTPDHNKKGKPTLPSGVGLAAAIGFVIGALVYVFGASFALYIPVASLEYLLATLLAVMLISIVGLLDDINVKRSLTESTGMMDTRKGLKQWYKPLLTFMGAIPLMAINAGVSTVEIPFIGFVNFGIFYPLVIIPLAVIFAANAFNLLGGFDGILTGTGTVLVFGMVVYSLFFGTYIGLLLSALLLAVLIVMLVFNLYPARMVPGDSFAYFAGTGIVASMILGNMEAFGVIISIPFIIEFLLHASRKFNVTDLGKLKPDGTMQPPYGKRIYSWCHLIMNMKRCREWEVSLYMWIIEAAFVVLALGLKALAVL